VLLHCQSGISRSASVAVAYCIKHNHMSFDDAYRHVKHARPIIAPIDAFKQQLVAYARALPPSVNPNTPSSVALSTPSTLSTVIGSSKVESKTADGVLPENTGCKGESKTGALTSENMFPIASSETESKTGGH